MTPANTIEHPFSVIHQLQSNVRGESRFSSGDSSSGVGGYRVQRWESEHETEYRKLGLKGAAFEAGEARSGLDDATLSKVRAGSFVMNILRACNGEW